MSDIAPNLQSALDDWSKCEPSLKAVFAKLEKGEIAGEMVDKMWNPYTKKLNSTYPKIVSFRASFVLVLQNPWVL